VSYGSMRSFARLPAVARDRYVFGSEQLHVWLSGAVAWQRPGQMQPVAPFRQHEHGYV
jgi:hypothetical protein